MVRLKLGKLEEVCSGAADSHVHLFAGHFGSCLVKLGLPGWLRHAYFEFHAHVRLRFKLASGLGEPWTRVGGYSSGLSLISPGVGIFPLGLGFSLSSMLTTYLVILICFYILACCLGFDLRFVGWCGLVDSLMDGPNGCDPAFRVVWFRFHLLRRQLALIPAEVGGVCRRLEMVMVVLGMVLFSISKLLFLIGVTKLLLIFVGGKVLTCSFLILLMFERER